MSNAPLSLLKENVNVNATEINVNVHAKNYHPASPLSPFSEFSPISPAEKPVKKTAFDYLKQIEECGKPTKLSEKTSSSNTMTTIKTNNSSMTASQANFNSHSRTSSSVSSFKGEAEFKSAYKHHAKAAPAPAPAVPPATKTKGGKASTSSSSASEVHKSGRRSSFVMKADVSAALNVSSEEHFLQSRGYVKKADIAVTLQGAIARYTREDGVEVVIKTTLKELHAKGIVKRNDQILQVKEDIIKEKELNELLGRSVCAPPAEFVKCLDFFENTEKFFLVQEFGGRDLFQWVVSNHQRINEGGLSLKRWRDHVRICFSQMCRMVQWLHSEQRVCHLDISLENSLIDGAEYDTVTQNINKDDCQVKFCDFGVAEFFSKSFRCNKFVGKKGYKAPEVVAKHEFDARKADVWSLGIVLFCMLIGAPPFKCAHINDDNFAAVISGKLKYLISEYGRLKYMSKFAFDLLQKIFVYEEHRITMQQILEHPYVKDVLLAKEQRQMQKMNSSPKVSLKQKVKKTMRLSM